MSKITKDKIKFNKSFYPKYDILSIREIFFLRTCCYFPPKKKRSPSKENVLDINKYKSLLERAYGSAFPKRIINKIILDHGCGEGGFSIAMVDLQPKLIVGLDKYSNMTFANQIIKDHSYKNIRLINDDIRSQDTNQYDYTISHDSFEHFNEPEIELEQMIRVTKIGGHILIKFGPTWKSPWGRHMSGTIRRDRPWVHLFFSERTIMRCYSVYHNDNEIKTIYAQKDGGLNKMTVSKFLSIISNRNDIIIRKLIIFPIFNKLSILANLPLLRDYFGGAISIELEKINSSLITPNGIIR